MKLLLIVFTLNLINANDLRIVCYYSNQAQYRRKPANVLPENINPNLCTHLIYAYARPEELYVKPKNGKETSAPEMKGLYSRMMKLKEINKDLKILLSVGGTKMGSKPFTPVVKTTYAMSTFATNVISYLRKNNFDGFDMAWEYPAVRESIEEDKPKFQTLMEVLMKAFKEEGRRTNQIRLMLTVATPPVKFYIDAGYFVANLSRTVDFISIMSVDLHGRLDSGVGFNSPLYAYSGEETPANRLNLHWIANYYVSLGAPPHLLNIAISTYGRSFTLRDPSRHSVMSPIIGMGKEGPYSGEEGILGYYEVCEMFKDGQIVDVPSQVNFYVVKDNQWVGYENNDSVKGKVCYINQNGYGGMVLWSIDYDDFLGTCNMGKFPILTAAYTALKEPFLEDCQTDLRKALRSTSRGCNLVNNKSYLWLLASLCMVWCTSPINCNHAT